MSRSLKPVVLIAGLLGAGILLAYGPGSGGPGFFGHHGAMHGGYGGHMYGTAYGPGAFTSGDIDARLAKIKSELGITSAQEGVWTAYTDSLKTFNDTQRATHQAMWSLRGSGPAAHYQLHQNMWQQHQSVQQAAEKLIGALNDSQRQKVSSLIGYGYYSFR